jgi:PAS domain S-box-containing protein
VPCYILDLEGTIVFANDATIQLTGFQREIDFKRSFISQLDDEYIDKTIEHIKTVLTGERLQVQIPIRHQNGKNIPVNIVSIPLEIRIGSRDLWLYFGPVRKKYDYPSTL